jgi:hypothetical protein
VRPQVSIGGDIALSKHNLVDAGGDMTRPRQSVLAEAHRLEKLLKQDFHRDADFEAARL